MMLLAKNYNKAFELVLSYMQNTAATFLQPQINISKQSIIEQHTMHHENPDINQTKPACVFIQFKIKKSG